MATIWHATKATAIAAILSEVTTNFIGTDADGMKYIKRAELRDWLISEFSDVFVDSDALPTDSSYMRDYFGNPPTEMDGILDRLVAAYEPETFKASSSFPLSTASQSKDELINQISKLQVDAQRAAEAIVIHYEDRVANIRPAVEQWFAANVLNLKPTEPGGFPEGVTRVIDTRAYIATFVTDWGWESAPSPASNLIDVDQNDTAGVVVAAGPSGRDITTIRLYRSADTSESSAWRFVKEAAHTGSPVTITDDVKQSALGETCSTFGFFEPPSGLKGLVGGPNGQMAGFVDQTVYFCEPFKGYAWPAYDVPVEHPIVGLGVFGQTYFVGTRANPYLISGADPGSMSAMKLEQNQACVSKRSIASVGSGVMYASPDGLCLADMSGVKILTQKAYSIADWRALAPETIFGVEHEGVYHAFYNNGARGCIAFDLASGSISKLAVSASAAYVDRVTDTMYVASGAAILGVYQSGAKRTGIWRSKRFRLNAFASMAWLSVDMDTASQAIIRLYVEGSETPWVTITTASATVAGSVVWSRTVAIPTAAAGRPIRLPDGRYLEWQIEVESAALVRSVVIASTTEELKAVS